MSKSRLSALLAALAVCAIAAFAAGCGSSDDEHHRRAAGGGGEKLTVGSDVPYPPFEEFGKTKTEFKGFDIELMEAIAEEDRPHAGIPGHLVRHDLPRPRPGQVRNGRLGDDDHRRTRGSGRLHQSLLPASAQAILVKKGSSDLKTGKDLDGQDRRRPAGHDRRGIRRRRNRRRGTPHLPAGPGHDPGAEGGHGRRGGDRPAGRRKRGRQPTAASKSRAGSKPKNSMDSSSSRATTELLEELNEGAGGSHRRRRIQDDLQEVVPQAGAAGDRDDDARSGTDRRAECGRDARLRRGAARRRPFFDRREARAIRSEMNEIHRTVLRPLADGEALRRGPRRLRDHRSNSPSSRPSWP